MVVVQSSEQWRIDYSGKMGALLGNPPGLTLDLDKEALEVFLYPLVQSRLFGTPPFEVYTLSRRRRLNRFIHHP
jgi:hypothetical protein